MKRCCLLLLFTVLCFCPIPVQASEIPDGTETEALYEAIDTKELLGLLPDDTKELLKRNGLDEIGEQALLDLSAGDFFKLLWEGFTENLTAPFSLLTTVLGILLLAALFGSLEQTAWKESTARMYHLVAVLVISGVLLKPLTVLLEETVRLLQEISSFFGGFIPIFAAIVSVSGKPISAFLYHGMLLGVVQGFQLVCVQLLLPLVSIYLAISVTAAATDKMDVSALTKSLKSIVLWVLGFLLTVFVAILTIKSFVASSADSVSLRAGRFLIGSFIPVVGGAISDAFTVLQGSLGVVKSAVGAFGILAMLACLLPALLKLIGMLLMLKVAETGAGLLGLKQVGSLLSAVQFVITFLQSVLICYGMMFLISTSLMLVLGGGGG